MGWLGGALLLIGGILFLTWRHQAGRAFSVKSARTVTVAELEEMAIAIAAEIGGGDWRDYVKVWGEIVAPTPLISEHQQERCVHYASQVTREYEVSVTNKQADGSVTRERERRSEQISSHRQTMPFVLRDRTGNLKINPEGADIETISILDEFRPERRGDTLGYRYQESVLPVGREVLVVGGVSDATGELVLGQPMQTSQQFLISLKNEETLAKVATRNARSLQYAMVGCLVLGGLLLLLALLW